MQNNINNNSKYFIVIKFCRKFILFIISVACLGSGISIIESVFAIEITIGAFDANNDRIPPATPIEAQKVKFSIQLDTPMNNITVVFKDQITLVLPWKTAALDLH